MAGDAIRVEGLAALRRECRKLGPDAARELRDVTKYGAQIVATQAGVFAPKGTRPIPLSRRPRQRLALSYRASTRGSAGIVRTPLLHGRIKEYRKSGTRAEMRGVKPVGRAIDARVGDVTRALERGFEQVAERHGFH